MEQSFIRGLVHGQSVQRPVVEEFLVPVLAEAVVCQGSVTNFRAPQVQRGVSFMYGLTAEDEFPCVSNLTNKPCLCRSGFRGRC